MYTPPERTDAGLSEEDVQFAIIEEEERQAAAVDVVATMLITAEQLKGGLRSLQPGFSEVFAKQPSEETEQHIRTVALQYSDGLRARYKDELPFLPFPSEQAALAAVESRSVKFQRSKSFSMDAVDPAAEGAARPMMQRLGQAEKVAEQFVARRIKPAIRRAQESDVRDLLKQSGSYLQGLWIRLNGGGNRSKASLPMDLPLPQSSRKEVELAISQIQLELEGLEKRVQEASKAREARLRNAGLAGRVQLATQMRLMDSEVLKLSRMLAVRTLQLELEHIYRSIEDELLDIGVDLRSSVVTLREDSSEELTLLVAEFALLEEQLTGLALALDKMAINLAGEELLETLATEIPDMRNRVGVGDAEVFGSSGFSLTRVRLQIMESIEKLQEAVNFLLRGVRLLGSDVANTGRLFSRAALGGNLKPREVTALRRTARDLLTFIPFTIILIIPLTPLGHVLIFGFIQRYFPGFFPSQFSLRRQEIMMRYEELRETLQEAQAAAEQEEEEAELARAAAAVARLTAPNMGAVGDAATNKGGGGQAARKVKQLERQLVQARDEVAHADEEAEGAKANIHQ